jgi:hypothetical protein
MKTDPFRKQSATAAENPGQSAKLNANKILAAQKDIRHGTSPMDAVTSGIRWTRRIAISVAARCR